MRQTFSKTERLTSKRVINRLFDRNASGPAAPLSVYAYPFRVLFLTHPNVPADATTNVPEPGEQPLPDVPLPPTQVLFSVPKRAFKKAVDRNLVRRRCREAYRLNKRILHKPMAPPVAITFLYTAKSKISFEDIEKGMKLALKRMVQH